MKTSAITPVGNWGEEVHKMLKDALHASVNVVGRTGSEACRHAIILMAQSARAITKSSKKLRKVQEWDVGLGKNRHKEKFVDIYNQGSRTPNKFFKITADREGPDVWENAKKIGNWGLAKRSWMWGLKKIGGPESERKPIAGLSRLYTLNQNHVVGYIKENKLGYVEKAMPSGWAQIVEMRVANKIMKQAANNIGNKWVAAIARGDKGTQKQLEDFFLKAN